jgi:tetrahydromethanopterin S-methyltransferase subunit B
LQQIARSKLQQLQQEVDSYLHALDPKFYAPLDVFGVHVEEVKA